MVTGFSAFLKISLFCFQQNKEIYKGLEQLEVGWSFLGELNLNYHETIGYMGLKVFGMMVEYFIHYGILMNT